MNIQGYNYCTVFDQPIDDDLVNIKKPKCIKEMNGCANCPKIGYKTEVNFISSKPVVIKSVCDHDWKWEYIVKYQFIFSF